MKWERRDGAWVAHGLAGDGQERKATTSCVRACCEAGLPLVGETGIGWRSETSRGGCRQASSPILVGVLREGIALLGLAVGCRAYGSEGRGDEAKEGNGDKITERGSGMGGTARVW